MLRVYVIGKGRTMDPIISVIIPVYNTGDILKQTIESILNQTFKLYELILVDDGSKDISAKICDEYAEKDPRVVVIHKSNGGICEARNVGLKRAQGIYITFCDHDDLYDKNILQVEYDLITKTKSDFVGVGYQTIYDNSIRVSCNEFSCEGREDVDSRIFEMISSGAIDTVWNKLYSRNIIGTTRFNTNFKAGQEDIYFNLEIIRKCNMIHITKELLYYHYVRGWLSTSAGVHRETVESMLEVNNNIYEMLMPYVNNNNAMKYLIVQFQKLRTLCVYSVKAGYTMKEFCFLISRAKYKCYGIKFNYVKALGKKNYVVYSMLKKGLIKELYLIVFCFVSVQRWVR